MDEPMTQFRAIPIEWGLSKNPYHKFLMWVSFKATFSGWGRCDALQVTFTMREAAEGLASKPSTISDWVKRAKAEGLLLPTGSFCRETGKGEVYNLGGDMLMTVKTPGQGPDKDRTRTGQVDAENSGACDDQPDKDRTSSGQAPDANKVYTPVSPATPTTTSPSRARVSRKKKLDDLNGYPDASLSVVRECLGFWPETAGDRKLDFDPDKAAVRVTEILAEYPTLDPALLVAASRRYLNELDERGSMKFCSALHFFFGPGKGGVTPKWKEQVQAINHAKRLEQENQ